MRRRLFVSTHNIIVCHLISSDVYIKSEPTEAPVGGWKAVFVFFFSHGLKWAHIGFRKAATVAIEIYFKVRVSEAMALCVPLHKVSREAISNKQPQSQGVRENFTGTVDG